MKTAVTNSLRTSLRTIESALSVLDFARARNAARYALRMLGKGDLLPAVGATLADWRAVAEIVRLSIQLRDIEAAKVRAAYA